MGETAAEKGDARVLGWREWVGLPELGIDHMEARVDTGSPTSRLHVSFVEAFGRAEKERVRFGVHPVYDRTGIALVCEAGLVEWRTVSGAGGVHVRSCVIATDAVIGAIRRRIEVILAGDHTEDFRVVLGRDALPEGCLVDPAATFLAGKPRAVRKTP